jgi:hypothetical protein
MCNSTPEDLFGAKEWQEKVAAAKAAGLAKCTKCNFVYYKTTDVCPHRREDTITTTRGSWWTAVKKWLDIIGIALSFGPPF